MYKATILRLKPGDSRIEMLPDWSEQFNGSVGTAKTKIEKEGLTLPRGGVIVLSKKSTKTNGAPVHFLLSTGTIANVVTGSNMLQEHPPLQRRKSAWKKFRDTFRFTTGLKKKTEQNSP